MKKINDLYNNRFDYDEESQKMIESLQLEEKALQAISDMKGTAGWKILGDKFRHELIERINEKIKDDDRINFILAILATVETKNASKLLAEELDKIIPN